MAAPALMAFDVPLIAAHFFVFYFGIVADITPPVCLAAYAGAGIARANPMKSGVTAFKLAIAAFLVPFAFVSNPVLLLEDWTFASLLPALITALLGMAVVSASLMNYFVTNTNLIERVVLFGAGIALIYPHGYAVSLAGLGVAVLVGLIQMIRSRKDDGNKEVASS